MRNPYAIRSSSPWVLSGEAKTRLFRKELLGEGVFQHPTRPWKDPLVVDEAYMGTLVVNTKAALAHGVKTPFPTTHSDGENPEANRGFLRDIEIGTRADGRKALYGLIEVTNDEIAGRLGTDLQDVSVYIDSFGSGDFTPEGDRIVHVALTNYPVYSGQENFVALSAGEGVSSIPVLQEVTLSGDERIPTMKITPEQREAAKVLSVTIDGEEVSEDLAAFLGALKMPAPAPVTEADVPRLLSVDATKDRYFSAYRAQVDVAINAEVEAAEKAGRLTTEMSAALRTLLSVTHGYALSSEGVAGAVDVPSLVRKVLSGIPEKAVVNVSDGAAASTAADSTTQRPPNEPPVFDAQAHADRILGKSK